MFCCSKTTETALHQAVIDNNLHMVRELAQHHDAKLEQNSLGFTPLELAQFLQRTEAMALLGHHLKKTIKIMLPDEIEIRHFTVEELHDGFGIKYLEHLHFSSYEAFKDAIQKTPRFSSSVIFGHEAQTLGRQYENEMKQGYTPDLYVRWIDNILGYGLFADAEIEEGEFIGEYTGLVRQLSRFKPEPNDYCFHYPNKWFSLHYRVVDAQNEGNLMRFMNHSEIPNVQPYFVMDRGLPHIIFLANQKIKKRTQLTFDYGKDYWMRRIKTDLADLSS